MRNTEKGNRINSNEKNLIKGTMKKKKKRMSTTGKGYEITI